MAAVLVTTLLVIQWRERRRVAMYQALAAQREEYRQAELVRMREEIEHRESAKKLEKQLKRELYEARLLEEERKANELAANEVLLRERMQTKYAVLEERKRDAREQQRLAEAEKKKAKEDAALRKALPGLYREVARETGEYTDNIGNTSTAIPRRLGGAQPLAARQQDNGGAGGAAASSTTTTGHAGSVAPEVVRMETVRAAQERLDSQVASGALPDAATLGEIENARREAERAAGIHSQKCPSTVPWHSTDTRAAQYGY